MKFDRKIRFFFISFFSQYKVEEGLMYDPGIAD